MTVGVVSRYWPNYTKKSEQKLLEDLIQGAAVSRGMNGIYIARSYEDYDQIYGTDSQSVYQYYWTLAVYIKNVFGFEGDKEFLSKFAGLEIRDQVKFEIPKRSFHQVIGQDSNFPPLPGKLKGPAIRPREGDLIWLPLRDRPFQIKYVNLESMFFPLGQSYTWEVTCELFEYSSEVFNTGIPQIDRIQKQQDLNVLDYLVTDAATATPILLDGSGDYWITDSYSLLNAAQSDNDAINEEANNYINWDEINPLTDVNNQGSNI